MNASLVKLISILALISRIQCELNDTEDETTTQNTEEEEESLSFRGLYGGLYYNYNAKNPNNLHYVHGCFQEPVPAYYTRKYHYFDEENSNTLDYYLSYGVSKMTDANFEYNNFHWYNHDINRTISENDTIPSDFIISCHPNATFLCPENTETICLRNGTIYCMSKIDIVVPCADIEDFNCVNSVVPCVRACIKINYNFEEIQLPCLSTVQIIDVYENKGKTISQVGGTFIISNALTEQERTFCVTVIVDPKIQI